MRDYTIGRARVTPELKGLWEGAAWGDVAPLSIDQFHDKSSDHRPQVAGKAVYDDDGLYVHFRVHDRFVRAVERGHNASVCRDSCVECFLEPVPGRGYFNFEINCGGTLLLHYNARSATVRYDPVLVSAERMDRVRIFHSLPRIVDPEIAEPTTWHIEMFAPFAILESYVGPVHPVPGSIWRGNFYKCADDTSKPHWAMWNRVGGALGFHKPEYFGALYLGE